MVYLIQKGAVVCDGAGNNYDETLEDEPFIFVNEESAKNYVREWLEHRPDKATGERLIERQDGRIEGCYNLRDEFELDWYHCYCYYRRIKAYK